MMPERGPHWRVAHRVAGLGSLGRERYVALADWHGGSVAREAKALAPSACVWAERGQGHRAHSLPGNPGSRGALPRPVRAPAKALDRAPPGAGLLAHRAFRAPQRARRTAPAARHGLGNRQRPPGQRSRPRFCSGPQETPRAAGCFSPRAKWKRRCWPISKLSRLGDLRKRSWAPPLLRSATA